jgi:hypothetical protein
VWADAVCINQYDNAEKGHQVKRMGIVYENAEEVLVWLGKDNEGVAEDCFNLIRETTKYLDNELEIYGGLNAIPTITLACPISFDKSRWDNVRKLVRMPWFSRLWVVQEAGLAKECKLFWSENQLSLAELCEIVCICHYVPELSNLVGKIGAVLIDILEMQSTYQPTKSWVDSKPFIKAKRKLDQEVLFLDLLHRGRRLETSLEVDRVFAFLGNPLARKYTSRAFLVEPDYSKSTQEVYFEIACSLLDNPTEAPYLLARVEHCLNEYVDGMALRKEGTLPSWVPRWDKGTVQYCTAAFSYWFRAGGLDRKFEAAVQIDRSLLLPAIIFDRIVWTSDIIEEINLDLNKDLWEEDTKKVNISFIDSLYTEVQQAFNLHCCDRHPERSSARMVDIENAFSLTMVQEYPTTGDFDLVQHQRNFSAYLGAARQLVSKHSVETHKGDANQILAGGSPFEFEYWATIAQKRRFAITKSGRFGLIPWLAQSNDVCCICPGVQVPLVLRRRENGRCGLVGDSYFHGVMRGEIIQQFDKGEVKLENVFLV